jgi:ApbE superfamily uncharacterized protein (UPF0280 family)
VSYTSIEEMAGSPSLLARVTGSAAQEGHPDAFNFVRANIWTIVAKDTAWADAWDFARANETDDDNPDTGRRPGVISDAMILAVIQPMVNPVAAP